MEKRLRRKIKSYFVFTAFCYRLVIFVILPLVMLAFSSLLSMLMGEKSYFVTLFLVPLFLIIIEIAADNWMFGGIQAKGAEKMDFLRTSKRGMGMMEDALTLDLIRRLFSMAGITLLSFLAEALLMGGTAAEGFKMTPVLLSILFFCYDISVLGTLIARFATDIWINFLVGYAGFFVGLLGIMAARLTEWGAAPAIVFAALAVPLNILTVKTAMKKVRGGYYDE